jgi:hypothetical protein
VTDEKSSALHGELEFLEPGTRFVTASLTPDQRTFLRILQDRCDRDQRQIESGSELRVVGELVGVVTVLDGPQDPAQIGVTRRG